MVSILIAARNEENTIINCLAAIEQLTYPAEEVEVWIGDDQSEDATATLVAAFIYGKPRFHLLSITSRVGTQKGKANVLAQLARKATGDFLFFTDADVQVTPTWITSMLAARRPSTGVISGCTIVTGPRLFDALQGIDWLYSLALIRMATQAGIPITAVGNNMAVSREAYEATGGYETLPFSLTEDHLLFNAIRSKGFDFQNLLQVDVLAQTQPAPSLSELLNQRKRWMQGAVQLPWYIVALLFIQALFLPMILLVGFFSPLLALGIWGTKYLAQSVYLVGLLGKLQKKKLIKVIPLYELYASFLLFALLVVYYLPTPVRWKGRIYD